MTADRARVSYNQSREYRMLIGQQGRVTLEADANEAATIASEALRHETVDVVGPVGAAGSGYLPASGKGTSGVSVGPGVFYLGGWRLALPAAIDLDKQPDWIDQPPTTIKTGNFLVALLLNEQVVGAVEDQALREVALGGPDTAARDRLMQHFLRVPLTSGKACTDGASAIAAQLKTEGLTIDKASQQLVSPARLQVGFVPGPTTTNACTPAAAGGYLGADNQHIRVTIIDYDATAKTGTLLWGWNNASIMYRATVAGPSALQLVNAPVDGEHAPQLNQAVELLHRQADLGDGNCIADAQGDVATVTTAYSFDSGQVGLTVPSDFSLTDTNPVFLRVWRAMVPFSLGQATTLDNVSGLTVTITGLAGTITRTPPAGQISLRPFWSFAVRPSTPILVYPQRYLAAGQPPEGPRQWIADLAVMTASSGGMSVIDNCLVPFLPLTQQQGCQCCGLTLGPSDVAAKGGLQVVFDSLAGNKSSLALLAGTYPLTAPLALTSKHNGLTLEACGAGQVILQAAASDLTPFKAGLIQLTGAQSITLRGLTLQIPAVAAGDGPQACGGIYARAAPGLTVDGCTFQYPAPASVALSGYGLLVVDAGTNLAVRRSTFAGGGYSSASTVWGIWAGTSERQTTTTLDAAEISDNVFQKLSCAVLSYAQLGFVRCTDNRVIGCGAGLYFADNSLGATGEMARQSLAETDQTRVFTAEALNIGLQAQMLAASATNLDTLLGTLPSPPKPPPVADTLRTTLMANFTSQATTSWTAHFTELAALHVMSPTAALALVGTPATGGPATGAPPPAGPAPAPAASAPAAPAPAAAAPASLLPTGASQAIVKALDVTQQIAVNAAVTSRSLTPVLHISGNDVALATLDANSTPGVGIAVTTSTKEHPATVLMTANRVLVPDTRTVAGSIIIPAAAAVTGNMFMQSGSRGVDTAPAFILYADPGTPIEAMGNVIHLVSLIVPARTNPPPTASWDFVNGVG